MQQHQIQEYEALKQHQIQEYEMAQRQEDEEIQADIDDYEAVVSGFHICLVHYNIDDYEAVQSGYEKLIVYEQCCHMQQ